MKFFSVILLLLITGCSAASHEKTVAENAFDIQPLLIGESVPDLSVTDMEGNLQSIPDIVSEKPAVLIFYRGGWCPFCSAHLAELASLEDEIYDLGYQILAISPDQPEFLRQSLEEQDLNYTLLSDSPMEASRAFGIAYRVDDETVARLKQGGMDIVHRSGYDHKQLPAPAVFITDASGKILFQYVNPEYRERISGEILITALRTFQN